MVSGWLNGLRDRHIVDIKKAEIRCDKLLISAMPAILLSDCSIHKGGFVSSNKKANVASFSYTSLPVSRGKLNG